VTTVHTAITAMTAHAQSGREYSAWSMTATRSAAYPRLANRKTAIARHSGSELPRSAPCSALCGAAGTVTVIKLQRPAGTRLIVRTDRGASPCECGTPGRGARLIRFSSPDWRPLPPALAHLQRYPLGYSVDQVLMITKHPRPMAIKNLRQDKTLRDHGGTAGVIQVLNPKFPDLIPRLLPRPLADGCGCPFGRHHASFWTSFEVAGSIR